MPGGEEAGGYSFSSSLQELQEMDMDPPSEGQVGGQELLLLEEHQQLESSWWKEGEEEEEEEEDMSAGEVRDDQKTRPPSPQQMNWAAEFNLEGKEQIGVTMGNHSAEPVGTLASDLRTDQPTTTTHIEVRQTTAAQVLFGEDKLTVPLQEEEDTRRMDVHLLPDRQQEEEVMKEEEEEVLSAPEVNDSSSSDVF